jgi:predicted NAD-dependent protein-ADP-ribosyltransferase YbiA (DUF1768 family)
MAITSFEGEFRWLSNFAYCEIIYQGLTYFSVEAAYQAQKTLVPELRIPFTKMDPSEAKCAGGRNSGLKIRPDWEHKIDSPILGMRLKDKIMLDLLKIKYHKSVFSSFLLSTGNEELIEGNWWHDNHFGDCHCGNKDGRHPGCLKPGENMLGKLEMFVREEIRHA